MNLLHDCAAEVASDSVVLPVCDGQQRRGDQDLRPGSPTLIALAEPLRDFVFRDLGMMSRDTADYSSRVGRVVGQHDERRGMCSGRSTEGAGLSEDGILQLIIPHDADWVVVISQKRLDMEL